MVKPVISYSYMDIQTIHYNTEYIDALNVFILYNS